MPDISKITAEFSIGPQIEADDIAQLWGGGFRSILNARPDTEAGDYMPSQEARELAEATGFAYAHCPTENHSIFETDVIDRFEQALIELPKPIFAHCKSGTRAAILWALVAARHRPVQEVIATLQAGGQELDFLEQELRDSAEEVRGSPLRLKDDALLNLGRSALLGERYEPK